jgi:hypothetical protein
MALDRFGLRTGSALVVCAGTLFSALVLITSPPGLQVVSFLAWACRASFLFTFAFQYVGATFDFAMFGQLNGVLNMVAGLLVLFNTALLNYAEKHQPSGYSYVNAVQLCSMALLALFPLLEPRLTGGGNADGAGLSGGASEPPLNNYGADGDGGPPDVENQPLTYNIRPMRKSGSANGSAILKHLSHSSFGNLQSLIHPANAEGGGGGGKSPSGSFVRSNAGSVQSLSGAPYMRMNNVQ